MVEARKNSLDSNKKLEHMLDIVTMGLLGLAPFAIALGYFMYRRGQARKQANETQFPDHFELRQRPLFSAVDRSVWIWLKQVFPEYEVLIKVPVVRFLSGTSGDLETLVQIKDIYCSFTLCSPSGRVIGCIDVPGVKGLKASRRDFKKNFFEGIGLPYTVLGPHDLPTLESLRKFFLNEEWPQAQIQSEFEELPSSRGFDQSKQDGTRINAQTPAHEEPESPVPSNQAVDVRQNLHAKLDGNRKRRLAAIESLKASVGIVLDTTSKTASSRWEDSFIIGEDSKAK